MEHDLAAHSSMFLNLIQIAESFGVSESVVEGWVRNEGLPHATDRGRLLFDRAQVADWAARRGLASQAGFLAPQPPALGSSVRLGPMLRAGGIRRDVAAADVPSLLERIVQSVPGATPAVRDLLGKRLKAAGGVTMAPVGGGFALPHPTARFTLGRDSGIVALLFLRDPLRLDEPPPDGVPVTRLIFFVAPSPRAHLDLLALLSRGLRGPLREVIARAAPDDEIHRAADALDASPPDAPGRR